MLFGVNASDCCNCVQKLLHDQPPQTQHKAALLVDGTLATAMHALFLLVVGQKVLKYNNIIKGKLIPKTAGPFDIL